MTILCVRDGREFIIKCAIYFKLAYRSENWRDVRGLGTLITARGAEFMIH